MRLHNEAMRIAIDAVRSTRWKVLRAAIAPMADGRFPVLRIAMRLRARDFDIDAASFERFHSRTGFDVSSSRPFAFARIAACT